MDLCSLVCFMGAGEALLYDTKSDARAWKAASDHLV